MLLCRLMLLTINVRAADLISPQGRPVSKINTQTDTLSYFDVSSKTLDLLILFCTSQLAKNVLSPSASLTVPNGSAVRIQALSLNLQEALPIWDLLEESLRDHF